MGCVTHHIINPGHRAEIIISCRATDCLHQHLVFNWQGCYHRKYHGIVGRADNWTPEINYDVLYGDGRRPSEAQCRMSQYTLAVSFSFLIDTVKHWFSGCRILALGWRHGGVQNCVVWNPFRHSTHFTSHDPSFLLSVHRSGELS